MNQSKLITAIAVVAIIVIILLFASGTLSFKDNRSTTDRVGDAIHALPDGADKAADQLGDRTPGQRVGDQIKGLGK